MTPASMMNPFNSSHLGRTDPEITGRRELRHSVHPQETEECVAPLAAYAHKDVHPDSGYATADWTAQFTDDIEATVSGPGRVESPQGTATAPYLHAKRAMPSAMALRRATCFASNFPTRGATSSCTCPITVNSTAGPPW